MDDYDIFEEDGYNTPNLQVLVDKFDKMEKRLGDLIFYISLK